VILTALLFVIVLSLGGASLLSLSLQTHRQADRNTRLLAAQAVADSELEALYYRWKLLLRSGTLDTNVADELARLGVSDAAPQPSTERTPLSQQHAQAGWKVRRSLAYETRMIGAEPGGTGRKTGARTYYTASVEVLGGPPGVAVSAQASRRLVIAETSLFQFALFYQGDLEIASGSRMDIRGPVVSNANIYVGGANGEHIQFHDRVSFGGKLNGDRDGRNDLVRRHPDSPPPPTGAAALTSPRFSGARRNVVKALDAHQLENFVGGMDIQSALAATDLFADENDVYRSVITPPPETGDLPSIAARRLYNQAGLRLRVSENDVDLLDTAGRSLASDPRFQDFLAEARRTARLHDHREGRDIQVTNVDIRALTDALDHAPDLGFNGIFYVEHTTPETGAVRLVRGETLPGNEGFTFGTNAGLYVQGSFNTSAPEGAQVPASISADAITLLSDNWRDDRSAGAISERVAGANITIQAGLLTGNTPTVPGRASGGAQNLVRLIEDWGGRRITLRGSIGQLFHSRYFTGAFPTTLGSVYNLPASRVMEFDPQLAEAPPPGRLGTINFLRGDYLARSDQPLSLEVAARASAAERR
jgi:hypothetical protein